MTAKEVSAHLKVPLRTIHRWIQSGRLKASQPAGRKGRYLIEAEQVEELLTESRIGPSGEEL